MAFLSDELDSLYKEFTTSKNPSKYHEYGKKLNLLIANKVSEGVIKNTKDLVETAVYVNGIVNRSAFVTHGIVGNNVVIRLMLDCITEEMAKKPYNYSQTLQEKLISLL